MVDYASEEEQVEALKRWWRDNGRSIVVGATLGVLALAGWRGWSWHQESQALEASVVYDRLTEQIESGSREALVSTAERLREDFASTPYAALGALAAARAAVDAGDHEGAADWLRWAMEHGEDVELGHLARGRLARVEAARGHEDQALELVEGEYPPAWRGLYGEIRGDILKRQGEREAAAEAYRAALDAEVPPPDPQAVERKLNQVQSAADPDTAGDSGEAT